MTKVVAAFGRLTCSCVALALAGAACLPVPDPKARLHPAVRGSVGAEGTPDFATSDGYRVHFDRRLIVLSLATATSEGSGRYGSGSVRNLDARPFDMLPIRGIGDRFVSVYTVSYYTEQPAGPGVTPEDLDMLDGTPSGENSRTNVAAFVMRGTLAKGDRRWTFDWRGSFAGPATCGRVGRDGLVPLHLESDSDHALDIVVHTERLFTSPTEREQLVGAPFALADEDGDGNITTSELLKLRAGDLFLLTSNVFEVRVDNELLRCDALGF